MRPILVCALMFVIVGSIFFVRGQEGQQEMKGASQTSDAKSTSDQIEVKNDRFSGVTTVKLKPQVVLDKPEHQLTIRSETKLGDKKSHEWEMGTVSAYVWLESHYNRSVDYGDRELHFIIDGKPLDIGRITGGSPTESTLKPAFKIMASFVSIFDRSKLEQISNGKRIEMRFGTVEVTLGQPVVATLREYASQVLTLDKTTREKKT
ncbi:MAG TPA: hypothetical protein VJ810_06660 [Blastocatellia bacterium]|nr:hypothetical protein [Blastocatellia bacterium]